VFPSIKAAAEFVGTYMSGISGCVRGITTTCAGYHWEYVDEEMRMQPNKPENLRRPPRKTIEDVQKEAERRSRETGRRVRYRHIQIEETLAMIRQRDKLERLKREAKR
jgi:hypothetical protein